MFRIVSLAAVAALVLATPAAAKVPPVLTPIEKLLRADAVVVGKVTALEKDTVDVTPVPDAPDKQTYQIAVMKIEDGLVGAANVTHVKVAFVPAPPADPANPAPPRRRGFGPVTLTRGSEGLFYLTKHHSGAFYVIHPTLAPIEVGEEGYKGEVSLVKKAAAVLDDPAKALKADAAGERGFAAALLVKKYRTYPPGGGKVETVKVPVEESRLILKALAEGSWDGDCPEAYLAISRLDLTDKDGWKNPDVKPGDDFVDKTREAFIAWVAGAGKDYRIDKLVTKE